MATSPNQKGIPLKQHNKLSISQSVTHAYRPSNFCRLHVDGAKPTALHHLPLLRRELSQQHPQLRGLAAASAAVLKAIMAFLCFDGYVLSVEDPAKWVASFWFLTIYVYMHCILGTREPGIKGHLLICICSAASAPTKYQHIKTTCI